MEVNKSKSLFMQEYPVLFSSEQYGQMKDELLKNYCEGLVKPCFDCRQCSTLKKEENLFNVVWLNKDLTPPMVMEIKRILTGNDVLHKGKRRTVIFRYPSNLAQQALLQLLEEGLKHTQFFIVTDHATDTIKSRCLLYSSKRKYEPKKKEVSEIEEFVKLMFTTEGSHSKVDRAIEEILAKGKFTGKSFQEQLNSIMSTDLRVAQLVSDKAALRARIAALSNDTTAMSRAKLLQLYGLRLTN